MLCRLLVLYLLSVNICLIEWSNTVQAFVLLTWIQLYKCDKAWCQWLLTALVNEYIIASEFRDGRPLFGGAPLILWALDKCSVGLETWGLTFTVSCVLNVSQLLYQSAVRCLRFWFTHFWLNVIFILKHPAPPYGTALCFTVYLPSIYLCYLILDVFFYISI